MAYVIAGNCIKDDVCIEVCPADCIHPTPGDPDFETAEQLYIDPDDVHRLRRLRRGVPGRRDLRRPRGAREVRLRARPERPVLRAAQGRPRCEPAAGGHRRRRAGGRLRGRPAAARRRRARGGPVRAPAHPVGPAARRRCARPPRDQAPGRDLRPRRAGPALPLPGQRGGGQGHLARRPDAPLRRGRLRGGRPDRQVAGHPRRGPARLAAGHRFRGLVQRPPGPPRAGPAAVAASAR